MIWVSENGGFTSQIMAILIGDHDDSPADLEGPRPTQTGLRFSLMIFIYHWHRDVDIDGIGRE